MLTIGLTGGIGCGKSTVSERFASYGIAVVDTDVLAREVVSKGSAALDAIAEHFGPQILLPDGSLDRRQLRTRIFQDAHEKSWLEALLHPLIRQRTRESLAEAQSPYVILSSPLLLQSPDAELVDRVVVIDLPETLQITRVSARDGGDLGQIRAIIASQMSREARRQKADYVIDNSGDLAATCWQVDVLHRQFLALSKQMDAQ